MKPLLKIFVKMILLLLWSGNAYSQNYNCIQPAELSYLVNANNYLRCIYIDSIKEINGDTVYFPYQTLRGRYNINGSGRDTLHLGASWVGATIVKNANGDTWFDNYWVGKSLIKTQASIGDKWLMYTDNAGDEYFLTVTAIDTTTFANIKDSVKTLTITAYHNNQINPSNPINALAIQLSKYHGFVQVPDLYMFPYHAPGVTYKMGEDFISDRIYKQ